MVANRAYEEVVYFIAAGSSPRTLVDFRPSESAKRRVAELILRERTGGLDFEEASQLTHYPQFEHIMRRAKARAKHLRTE